MIKRSPSRNHRSKGIKVGHVLQIILLLGVCFWLIYQVKHSHDKKKEFDENDPKLSVGTPTAYQIPKLGRKDLHPGKDEVNQNEKLEEEEEDENIIEDDENKHEHIVLEEGNGRDTDEKEDGKHGVRGGGEEQEEDENKSEEIEDERGGGDDEIDENGQEKSEVDTDDHDEEEFMDEEKEKEEEEGDEKDNENSEDVENRGSVENHITHEAREEHYKGDDASSAVTHDTHTTGTETETVSLENSDVSSEMSITKSENKPNYTEEGNRNQTDSDFKVPIAELMGGTSSNATSGTETGNKSLSNPVDSSHLNNTVTSYSDGHMEASTNLTVAITEASNNMTGTGADISSEQDKLVIFPESNQAQNNTVNTTVVRVVKNVQTEGSEQGGNKVSEENLPDSNSLVPVKPENGDAAAGESSNLEAGELENARMFVALNETDNNSRNLDRNESTAASEDDKPKGNTETSETNNTQSNSNMKENTDATEDEKFKGNSQTGETDETSDSNSALGTSDSVEHDATDSSDSHILKDVTEVRTDLDTLPDIINEEVNGDGTATE